MQFRFSGQTHHLSQGTVRFVTQRTMLTVALSVALVVAGLSLAVGIVIGTRISLHGNGGERDYTIDQLGKLNAALAQIEPRMARLTAQVGALHDFETRQHTLGRGGASAPVMPTVPVEKPASGAHIDTDAEGGPLLPARRCDETASAGGHDIGAVGDQLDCLSATLAALEKETSFYAMAYSTFPGRMPVNGARFSSPFGPRIDPFTHALGFHPGIDLAAPAGTPILAAAGGRVVIASAQPGYGNEVEIDHGNGLMTRYGHASRIYVHVGEVVLPSQHIADIGSTGRSTGPHLHFEVRVDGQAVNPVPYLALLTGGATHG